MSAPRRTLGLQNLFTDACKVLPECNSSTDISMSLPTMIMKTESSVGKKFRAGPRVVPDNAKSLVAGSVQFGIVSHCVRQVFEFVPADMS